MTLFRDNLRLVLLLAGLVFISVGLNSGLSNIQRPQGDLLAALSMMEFPWSVKSSQNVLYESYLNCIGYVRNFSDEVGLWLAPSLYLLGFFLAGIKFYISSENILAAVVGATVFTLIAIPSSPNGPAIFSLPFLALIMLGIRDGRECQVIGSAFELIGRLFFVGVVFLAWSHLDFGVVLLIPFFLLAGVFTLLRGSCGTFPGLPALSLLMLILSAISQRGRELWMVLVEIVSNEGLHFLGVYAFATPNFHIQLETVWGVFLLFFVAIVFRQAVSLYSTVCLVVALLFAIMFKGSNFIFAWFLGALIAEKISSSSLKEANSSLKLLSLVVLTCCTAFRIFSDSPEHPYKLVSGEKFLLSAIQELSDSDVAVFNQFQFGSSLSTMGVTPFVDERGFAGFSPSQKPYGSSLFEDYYKLVNLAPTTSAILEHYAFEAAVVYKGSPLYSHLTLVDNWLVVAEGAEKSTLTWGRKKNQTVAVLRK